MSSSPISCLSIFLMYCPCITLFFHFFFRYSPNLAFVYYYYYYYYYTCINCTSFHIFFSDVLLGSSCLYIIIITVRTRITTDRVTITANNEHLPDSGSCLKHFCIRKVKDKAIPLQAWKGPEVSRRMRLPDLMTIGT